MIDLRNGDAYKLIKSIPDKSIDLIITDPPYLFKIDGAKGCFGTDLARLKNDIGFISTGFDLSILDEFKRVMKKVNIYIWCSNMQLRSMLDYFDGGYNVQVLAWIKTNPIPAIHNRYCSDIEYCVFAREKGVPLYTTINTGHKAYISPLNVEDKKYYKHPTIKPLGFIENMVENSSKKGDVVLDPFMGSGTTGVACAELDRSFIGFEIEKRWFDVAKQRIKYTNVKLF